MAISTIGNITYINQNMQTTSAAYANAAQRGDIIPQEFEDKLKEIQEVRPTETDMKINKDSKNKLPNPFCFAFVISLLPYFFLCSITSLLVRPFPINFLLTKCM